MEIDHDINFLNANWVHSNDLLTLKELKQKNLKSEDKEKFKKRSLKEQIREVVYDHGPSELKMVYVQNCTMLRIPASVDFFKNGSKDKERFFEFIWEHRKSLRSIQDRYDYHLLKCLFDMPIYILKHFSISCHSDYNQTSKVIYSQVQWARQINTVRLRVVATKNKKTIGTCNRFHLLSL